MILTDLDTDGQEGNRIACYTCRGNVLTGLVNHPGDPDVCVECGLPFPVRSLTVGTLTTDLSPNQPDIPRHMMFCRVNGSRDQLWARFPPDRRI
jgi:hypothetical protein